MRWVSSPMRIAPAIRAEPFKVCKTRFKACGGALSAGFSRQARTCAPTNGMSSSASSRNTGRSCSSKSSLIFASISMGGVFAGMGASLKLGGGAALGCIGIGGFSASTTTISGTGGAVSITTGTSFCNSLSRNCCAESAAISAFSRAVRASMTICRKRSDRALSMLGCT